MASYMWVNNNPYQSYHKKLLLMTLPSALSHCRPTYRKLSTVHRPNLRTETIDRNHIHFKHRKLSRVPNTLYKWKAFDGSANNPTLGNSTKLIHPFTLSGSFRTVSGVAYFTH